MPISETTKQIAAQQRAILDSQIRAIGNDLSELSARRDALLAQRIALKVQLDALKADIPEPTPMTEPMP